MPPSSRYTRASCKQLATTALLLFATAVAPQVNAHAQTHSNMGKPAAAAPASSGPAAKLSFDAASVRPGRKGYFNDGGFLDPVNKLAPPVGGLFSWNVPVVFLIKFAYDLRTSQLSRQAYDGLPKQLQQEPYAIQARAEGEPTRADVRQMVQSLLEDRFKLAAHRETREGEVYALVVAKSGLGLKPHAEGAPCTVSATTGFSPPFPYPPYTQYPAHCGVFDRELGKHKRRMEMLDVTLQQIADTLSNHVPLAVVDSTGLAGRYDAILDYGPNEIPPDTDAADEVGLPTPAALERQLGLKLVKQKATVDTFILDHIEPPTDN